MSRSTWHSSSSSQATDAQVASALGISDAAAWSKVAVTPMIGVNDTSDEVFTVANAQQLAAFAAGKTSGLGQGLVAPGFPGLRSWEAGGSPVLPVDQ